MRKNQFIPRAEILEAKLSLSGDTPIPVGPVAPGIIQGPLAPVSPPGMGNPDTTTPLQVPNAPTDGIIGTIIGYLLPPVSLLSSGSTNLQNGLTALGNN